LSSIFHSDGLDLPFSNSDTYRKKVKNLAITDFAVFNPYIHYSNTEPAASEVVQDPNPITIDYKLDYE
jgi:hypothetical protein